MSGSCEAVGGEEAYIVGGAVRDELLGRPVVDLDIACPAPAKAARSYAGLAGGAVFPLSDRHGAWRVAFRDGRTVDFTPLPDGIEADLGTRDLRSTRSRFRSPGESRSIPTGAAATSRREFSGQSRQASSRTIRFAFCAPPGSKTSSECVSTMRPSVWRAHIRELVRSPAGERILGELARLSLEGFRRLDRLGLLAPLGGSLEKLDRAEGIETAGFSLVCVFGPALEDYPISNRLRRQARTVLRAERPPDGSARSLHRFRRATEPWSREALAYLGCERPADRARGSRARRIRRSPSCEEMSSGWRPGPTIGRLLELIAEERAAGAISTREEALDLVRRDRGT